MSPNRREFLKAGAALSAVALLPRFALAQAVFAPAPGAWRSFQIVTRLEIAQPEGLVQAWVPLPSVNEADWFRSDSNAWNTNARSVQLRSDPTGAQMLHLQWAEGEKAPVVEITSRITTRDRAIDLTQPGSAPPLSESERSLYLAPTALIPTDGIVKETADKITANAGTEVEKARAIYEWIVENTFRDPKVRGCGVGDIASMLQTGNLGGKCADLNALYVGLARASGLPARDIYGIRVAPSRFGYKSLGASSEVITKSQHCRAEVYLSGYGWVPVDAADVRKVILEEPPGNLAIDDEKVAAVRAALFGSWEGNWLAYNFAHDVTLPDAKGPKVAFLMYPQAESAGVRCDCLDPATFVYTIKASEIDA